MSNAWSCEYCHSGEVEELDENWKVVSYTTCKRCKPSHPGVMTDSCLYPKYVLAENQSKKINNGVQKAIDAVMHKIEAMR